MTITADFLELRLDVINALENVKFDWRTIEGISDDLGGLPEKEIEDMIQYLIKEENMICSPSYMSKSGQKLYTTRSYYKRSRSLLTRVRACLLDRVI